VDLADLDADARVQFDRWFDDARASGVPQPEAMALATATLDAVPSVRMVLLRGHDERGFVFYTNRSSRKARELAANQNAASVLCWEPLHRQVRIEGLVETISEEDSAAYFRTRPRDSRISAWASPQSEPLAGRDELDRLVAEAKRRFEGIEDVPLPPFWGGYRIVASAIEFWQGQPSRLHDRIRYERVDGGWRRERLAP